jgi:hypothetical protein
VLKFYSQFHTSLLKNLKSYKHPTAFDTDASFPLPHPTPPGTKFNENVSDALEMKVSGRRTNNEFFVKTALSHLTHAEAHKNMFFQENHKVIVLRISLRQNGGRGAYLSFKAHNLFRIQSASKMLLSYLQFIPYRLTRSLSKRYVCLKRLVLKNYDNFFKTLAKLLLY